MYQNSKLEVRLEAVKLASSLKDVTLKNVIQVSKAIEKYIVGEAELPETYDANTYMDAFTKVLENVTKTQNDVVPEIPTTLKNEKEKAN